MDIGAFARIFDASAYRDGKGDNIWRPLISRVVYGKMTGSGAGRRAPSSFDEIAIENVDGRQPEEPFTDVWDRLMDPAVPQDAKNDLALDAVTTMFAAWRVGTIRVDGISVEAPKENVSFSLEQRLVTGWSNAGLDSFILEGAQRQRPGWIPLARLARACRIRRAGPEGAGEVRGAREGQRASASTQPRSRRRSPRCRGSPISACTTSRPARARPTPRRWRTSHSISATGTRSGPAGRTFASRSSASRGICSSSISRRPRCSTRSAMTTSYVGMSVADRWDPDAGTDDATWTFSMKDAVDVELSYSLTGLTLDWLMRATAAAGASEDSEAALMAMLNDLQGRTREAQRHRPLAARPGFCRRRRKAGPERRGRGLSRADAGSAALPHLGRRPGRDRQALVRAAAGIPGRRSDASRRRRAADAARRSGLDGRSRQSDGTAGLFSI